MKVREETPPTNPLCSFRAMSMLFDRTTYQVLKAPSAVFRAASVTVQFPLGSEDVAIQ